MTITTTQAQALATFITRLRPDWDHPGVVAAIAKAAQTAPAFDVARALISLAENPDLRTPAILAQPGAHWRKWDGSTVSRRGDHDMACPEHPGHVHPCPQCRAEKPPLSDEGAAVLRALAQKAKTLSPKPKFATAHRPETDLDAARARIAQEAKS